MVKTYAAKNLPTLFEQICAWILKTTTVFFLFTVI